MLGKIATSLCMVGGFACGLLATIAWATDDKLARWYAIGSFGVLNFMALVVQQRW